MKSAIGNVIYSAKKITKVKAFVVIKRAIFLKTDLTLHRLHYCEYRWLRCIGVVANSGEIVVCMTQRCFNRLLVRNVRAGVASAFTKNDDHFDRAVSRYKIKGFLKKCKCLDIYSFFANDISFLWSGRFQFRSGSIQHIKEVFTVFSDERVSQKPIHRHLLLLA